MPPRIINSVNELTELVGKEIGASDWLTVTQPIISAFADVTGDRQWIHLDVDRARSESPYRTTIAHGFLTLSLLSQLQRQIVEFRGDASRVINYGLNRVRFPAAVTAGARIRARSSLTELAEVEGGTQLTWTVTVEIEGQEKPALVAEWIGRVYR